MKINNNSKIRNKRNIIILVSALLAVAIIAYWYFALNSLTRSNHESTTHIDKTSAIKQTQVTDSDNTNDTAPSSLPQKTSTSTINSPSSLDGNNEATLVSTIEKPNVTRFEHNGEVIKIVATFTDQPSGLCKLRLESPDKSQLYYESPIVLSTSYYVCNFNIPVTNPTPSGDWTAVLHQQTDNNRSDYATEKVKVN